MQHITDRMYNKKWGVFNHYLDSTVLQDGLSWNDCVNSIDVKKIAKQLHDMGAGYYFITLQQVTKHMLAPNATFDKIAGTEPGDACAERDVVSELYDELSKYGIDLYLYFTSDGPHFDSVIGKKFGFYYEQNDVWDMENNGSLRPDNENSVLLEKRLSDDYIEKWSSVLKEYAVRYGDKVCGWWMDGFYTFFGYNQDKMKPFYNAIKAGNPNAVVAFNKGVHPKLLKWYEKEEFTAGEFNELEYVPDSRFLDGAQSHILAPLGSTWGKPDARYDNEYMRNYIRKVNEHGGVVTVDIKIKTDGSYCDEQIKALSLKNL